MSYLEFLKLASPEAIVVLTALSVLAIGLASARASAFCSFFAALGLGIAIGAVFLLPQNATLFAGMLVISPLASLFKIICISLAFFTVLLARSDGASRNHGEYLAMLLLATIGLMLLVGSHFSRCFLRAATGRHAITASILPCFCSPRSASCCSSAAKSCS